MLTDKDVLNYGLKKALETEALFLAKLRMYEKVSTGGAKKLIKRLITQEAGHVEKLRELITICIPGRLNNE